MNQPYGASDSGSSRVVFSCCCAKVAECPRDEARRTNVVVGRFTISICNSHETYDAHVQHYGVYVR
jgi:hypothetical protein